MAILNVGFTSLLVKSYVIFQMPNVISICCFRHRTNKGKRSSISNVVMEMSSLVELMRWTFNIKKN